MKFRNILLPLLFCFSCSANTNTEKVGTVEQSLTSVTESVGIPSNAAATATAAECQNSPGPFITLDGALYLGGFGVELVFRNNVKGTHEHVELATLQVSVMQEGESITIPKQPVLGGVGGNPYIFVQFLNGDNVPITQEVLLGRCVQGLNNVDLSLLAPGIVDTWLTGLSCENSPGPYISVDGFLTMGSVKVRIIFRNNMIGTHETDVVKELTVLEEGTTFTFPKQPPLGGVGGNPHIYLRFVDGKGSMLGEEVYLGRCKQLSKNL